MRQTFVNKICDSKWSTVCDKKADTASKINELEQKFNNLEVENKTNKQSVEDCVQKL